MNNKLQHKKKIKIIENILDSLYPNPISSLYYTNEYTLLIAILLSTRSREKKVNEITKYLFQIIKTPKDTISLSIQEIKNFIKDLGLHNKKSKNIYELSLRLMNKYNNMIPHNILELKSLPGIGHKAASVFLSHVSNYPTVFPVDTHIHRMMFHWKLSNGKNIQETEKDAKRIFKKKNWKKLHLQMIFYAKEYYPLKKGNSKKDVIFQELLKNNLLNDGSLEVK
ncbi:endonuclease III domain-containing protein [Blattabacterium cuenoti]|uniref:endonuclease III domain-containing protein n=1 Tax=Blattabacterium cuenoti TaxID=1653831 RepID=UPI00163CBE86|nr:endonuclease III [Blattabacterium cuenoti]